MNKLKKSTIIKLLIAITCFVLAGSLKLFNENIGLYIALVLSVSIIGLLVHFSSFILNLKNYLKSKK